MTDAEFLRRFFDASLPNSEFKHQSHIRLTWLCLRSHDFSEASRLIIKGIKKYAAAQGASQKYHETLTRIWIQLVADAIARHPDIDNFEDFIHQASELLNKDLPLQYYSKELLNSELARQEWIKH